MLIKSIVIKNTGYIETAILKPMKKIVCFCISILFCICSIFITTACDSPTDDSTSKEMQTDKYYCADDFRTLVAGESTYNDVYDIAPPSSIRVTSYGAVCDYPQENGGYIRIKLYGSELIVGEIDIITNSSNSQ